jgi:hypothetical protein
MFCLESTLTCVGLSFQYMKKGTGRGRRRNSSVSRNPSIRAQSSPPPVPQDAPGPHSTTLPTGSNPVSLRRSARIAELLNRDSDHQPATATPLMADVARPRTLGSRSVRSRHQTQNTRTSGRSRSGHHSLAGEDIQYAMDIVVQPPQTARVGHTIPGSIIVRLRTTNTDPDDAIANSSNLVALATLVPGPNSSSPTDPSVLSSLLAGRRFDSIHSFADDEADGSIASMDMAGPQGVGYMRFPDLVIRQVGTYRIRITLVRMPTSNPSGSGVTIQIVDSNPIVVHGSGGTSSHAAYNGKYMVATY